MRLRHGLRGMDKHFDDSFCNFCNGTHRRLLCESSILGKLLLDAGHREFALKSSKSVLFRPHKHCQSLKNLKIVDYYWYWKVKSQKIPNKNFWFLYHSLPLEISRLLGYWRWKSNNWPQSYGQKTESKTGNLKHFTLLVITLWPMLGLSKSIAQLIAVDSRNRMIFRLTNSD